MALALPDQTFVSDVLGDSLPLCVLLPVPLRLSVRVKGALLVPLNDIVDDNENSDVSELLGVEGALRVAASESVELVDRDRLATVLPDLVLLGEPTVRETDTDGADREALSDDVKLAVTDFVCGLDCE